MTNFFQRNHLSPWIVPGAIIIMGILFGLCGLMLWIFTPGFDGQPQEVSAVTSIPASTSTPLSPDVENTDLDETSNPLDASGIGLDLYVQITNTGGVGLRLRSGPGTNNPARFLGKEDEVFQVKDGPRIADGFTWWYLVTPYDEHRSGWAASKYLVLIETP